MQPGLLPLFPLEVVLMPGGHLPLHIFEERYKEMIGEARRDHSEFGIVLASREGLAETGCTATIEGVLQEYPDGRLDIVTLGRRRFEILLVNEERSFLRGAVEFFDDEPGEEPVDTAVRETAISGYNALQTLWNNPALEDAGSTDPQVSFRLARAVRDLPFRQALLKSRSEAERIARLAAYLPDLAAKLKREQEVKTSAHSTSGPSNGHAPYLNGNGRH
ncbi:MAG: LON peptidase substrate-binding domain-containing protein [Acidobacteriota bacterium]